MLRQGPRSTGGRRLETALVQAARDAGLRRPKRCGTSEIDVPRRAETTLRTLSIREVRSALSRLDEVVAEAGEVVVTRRGRPLARILPVRPARGIPSRKELRAAMPRLRVSSEILVRRDRDGR
jgi:prevent-host-death family protein